MRPQRLLTKLLALVLSIIVSVSSVQLETLAENSTVSNQAATAGDTQTLLNAAKQEKDSVNVPEPHITAEMTEERTETTKTFRLSDGSYAIAAYDQPIHYENEEGRFEEIDNTFELSNEVTTFSLNNQPEVSVYSNRAGRTKITFKEACTDDSGTSENVLSVTGETTTNSDFSEMVSMEVAGQTISWGYEGISDGAVEWEETSDESNLNTEDKLLTVSGATSKGIYQNAFVYTDIEYLVSPEGIKENIILKDKRAGNEWTLKVNIGNLTAVQTDEQTVKLYSEGDEPEMIISAPEMVDAEGKMSTDITLDMTVSDSVLSLTITADERFLQSNDTVYPVTVDPYFYVIASSEISISDTFLSAKKPSASMRSDGQAVGSLIVGNESSTYGKTRALLKLDTLPQLPAGSVITDARLILKNYYSYSGGNSMTVEVRRATGAWTQSGATWNNSANLYESAIQDYYIVPQNMNPSNLFDSWEITRLVKGWYEGTYGNYGVMLTAIDAETASPASCTKYYSSNCPSYTGLYPTFLITFRSNAGLEDYWTYHAQSVNGGTGYINDYSGNLVFTIPVAETTGLNLPVGINFVYNSYISNQHYRNNTKGAINGAGWMTTYSQRLDLVSNMPEYSDIAEELIAQGFDYVWLDADGTHHFFKKQSDGTYEDEDGLGLVMKTGQSYGAHTNVNIIEDKEGNKIVFLTNGYLLYLGNHLNQMVSLQYSGANLAWIKDGAGRKITINYVSSTITSITGPNGTISFNYAGYNLTKVNYPDGTKMYLEYTSTTVNGVTYHLLSSVTGRDGNKLVYTYGTSGTAQQRCRVKSVTEYAADGTMGNRITLNYTQQNITKITYNKTSGAITETYQFNDWGHTTGVVGDDGNSSNIQYNTTTSSASKNQITQVSAGARHVNNLLTNHSAESGISGWNMSKWMPVEADFSIDTTESYLGYQSLKVSQNNNAPERCGWVQTVSVTEGKTYTFSAYAKSEDIIPRYAGGGTLYVVMFNGSTELQRAECDTQLLGNNDWQRLSITFTVPEETTTVKLYGGLRYANGTAWFDCFQLEEGDTVSPYNLLENSALDTIGSWSSNYTTTYDGITDGAIQITGSPTIKKNIYQNVKINKAGVAFYMRASAQAMAAPNTDNADRIIAIDIGIYYEDGTAEWAYTTFNSDISDWQTVSFTAAPSKENANKIIRYINAYVFYYEQVNTARFDDIMVTIDETGTTYSYDDDGNLITSSDNAKRQTTYTINDATDMVTAITDSTNTVYSYTYDTKNAKQLKTAKEKSTGIGYEYTYGTGNNVNNVEKVQMGTVGSMTLNKYIQTGTEYTDNGAYVETEIGQRDNRTEYTVDTDTGEVSSVTDPLGNTTSYIYDGTSKNLTNVTSGTASVVYDYYGENTAYRLKSIISNNQAYNFLYDKWFNLQNVNIGESRTLVTNTYAEANGNLLKSTYGNGDFFEYIYDKYDRVIGKKTGSENEEAVQNVSYFYNANGQLAKVNDLLNGDSTNYMYDLSGRVVEYFNSLGRLSYGYDNLDRTSKFTLAFNNMEFITAFNYLSANRPGVTTLPIGKVDRTYDSLQREAVHQVYADTDSTTHLRSETTFLDMEGNRTTELISGYDTYVGTSDTDKTAVDGYTSFRYIYDANGNINIITELNGTQSRTKSYVYDSLNQLVRENDEAQGKTITYTYDNGGNLLSKSEYAYTTGELGEPINTIIYSYGDEVWKDLLTAYNGQPITYDEIGNPLTYYNGMTFNWEQGRKLAGTTLSDGTTISYTYNTDGIRIGKKVGEIETTYFVDSSGTIQALKQGEESLVFMYDATGRREGFIWYTGTISNGAYYYLYNAQSDVIGIVANDYTPVVLYEYNSWGKTINVSGSKAETLGELNPFRYRGYVYDAETGFYYLQSRYYDAEIGRFINADGQLNPGILGVNLFIYCENNPICRSDSTGKWFGLDDMFTGFVDEIIVVGFLGILSLAGSKSAQNTLQDLTSYLSDVFSSGKPADTFVSTQKQLTNIALKHGEGYCDTAAKEMADYLKKRGEEYKVLKLVCPPWDRLGNVWCTSKNKLVGTNGYHVGVLYMGKVYCTVHVFGVSEWFWRCDFVCESGWMEVEYLKW